MSSAINSARSLRELAAFVRNSRILAARYKDIIRSTRSVAFQTGGAILLRPLSWLSLLVIYAKGKITFNKNVPSSLFSGITSFAGSIQMIFFSRLTCTIRSQGDPNKMAATNFLWLYFLNNRSSIQFFFLFCFVLLFLDQWYRTEKEQPN